MEEHRLKVFENEVLSRIYGPNREEVTGGWRKLHNGDLHTLHSSPSIIRVIKLWRIRWSGHVASMGAMRNVHKILPEKHLSEETTWKE
jgi:hypothetical protein